jgi:uncharacterized ion transporter superfamily protein YfcC
MIKLIRKVPDTIGIILSIMVIFIILTWIIPAGEFDYREYRGRMAAVPGSYHTVDPAPQGLWALLMAPIRGFTGASQIIGFCFLVGGAFGIINRSGAINAGLFHVIERSRDRNRSRKWILAMIMVLFSLAGATFGMSESVLVFIMITIPLAIALGYDSITGISISFLAAGVGFAGALTNPFTIGIAQGIAEIELFSGWEYRLLIWLLFTSVAILFVLRYAAILEKDPARSPVFKLDRSRKDEILASEEEMEFNLRRKIILYLLFASLILLMIGSNIWKWYINEISGLFLALGVLTAFVYRLSLKETTSAFFNGARDMLMAAMVIALARGLLVIATDGKIIDTMLHAVANATGNLPRILSAEMMFLFQGVLNFFIPSGSGQAALTMPIMAPLSDLLGISRQTAVLCFQMGDGIFNMIIPTSGVTMGVLSISRIPYSVWVRWLVPLTVILTLMVFLLLIPPVLLFQY